MKIYKFMGLLAVVVIAGFFAFQKGQEWFSEQKSASVEGSQDLVKTSQLMDHVPLPHLTKAKRATDTKPGTFHIAELVSVNGSKVTVTSEAKKEILSEHLAELLMSAKLVPHYDGDRIMGFRLAKIQKGSVFEKVGFETNDIVTAINGEPISDPTSSINLITGLRSDNEKLTISYLNQGKPKSLEISVQGM